jgi:hypothetical protein
MQVSVEFTEMEVQAVKNILENKLIKQRRFVINREAHNVDGTPPNISDDDLWFALVMCLLTTQQRSGPGEAVDLFIQQEPFPLSLHNCRHSENLREMAFEILTAAKGIRRTEKISKAMHVNLQALKKGQWSALQYWRDGLLKQRSQAPNLLHREIEEQAANYLDDTFLEFGPKQSRNFWQILGLTRYTFVLDSRILKWLHENLKIDNGLLVAEGLVNRHYYRFISDILLKLCHQAAILPCMFDAVIFDAMDEVRDREWSDTGKIW